METDGNEARSRTCSSDQAARMATALALPPNTVARWLRFGASGADSCTDSSVTSTAATSMARDKGISWCRYCSSDCADTKPSTATSRRFNLLIREHALDPSVRNQPQQRDQDIYTLRD